MDTRFIVEYPRKAREVLFTKARYKILYGGRGRGASWSIARYILEKTGFEKNRALCTREIQKSIKDSVHRLLEDQIDLLGWKDFFTVKQDTIIGNLFGSEIIFKGLRHNSTEIKSTEGIDICWVEEAERVTEENWRILIPTIRKENSEILVSFNPEEEKSATYKRFVTEPPPDSIGRFMTYDDNPAFPNVLRREMEYDKKVDPDKWEHIWRGKPKRFSKAQIFKNKVFIEEFDTPEDVELLYGTDWGYSVDAHCLVRMFIKDRCLYIDHEFYGVGIELGDEMVNGWDTVPGSRKWTIRGDSARPDLISFMSNKGFAVDGAKKGAGSVEDGIMFLRSFEKIIIHPRCKSTKGDYENYKWKTDKLTGEILPIPEDKNNHAIDASRYALEPYIKSDEVKVWSLGEEER